MTLNPTTITFRLENLLDNPFNYKNNEKELLSIIKVLKELAKENKRNSGGKIVNIALVLDKITEKIAHSGKEKLQKSFRKNGGIWKLTMKEKQLLFTLKVI